MPVIKFSKMPGLCKKSSWRPHSGYYATLKAISVTVSLGIHSLRGKHQIMLIAKAEKVRTFPHIAFTRISVGQYAIEGPFTQRTAAIKQDLPRVAWIFRPDYHPPCVGFTPHFRIAEVHDSFWWSEDHTLFLEMNTIPTGSQTLYFANCIVITCTIEPDVSGVDK